MRKLLVRLAAAAGILAASFYSTALAMAACASGTTPSYSDTRYVSVVQFSFPNDGSPNYKYEGMDYPADGSAEEKTVVRLTMRQRSPITGDYVASHPLASFQKMIGILRSASFFDMRLSPAVTRYIDGQSDAVTIVACGIRWSLGTLDQPGEVALDDANARRFISLENNLRASIFADDWSPKLTQP